MDNIYKYYKANYYNLSQTIDLKEEEIKEVLIRSKATGFISLDENLKILTICDFYINMLGFKSIDEFLKQNITSYLDLVYKDDQNKFLENIKKSNNELFEYRLKAKNKTIWVDSYSVRLKKDNNIIFHSIKEHDEKFENILEKMKSYTYYRNALGIYIRVSYQIDITEDIVLNKIFDTSGFDILKSVELDSPCKYSLYCKRWEKNVSKETLDSYRKYNDIEFLKNCYNSGTKVITTIYETKTHDDEVCWFKKALILSLNNENNHIEAQVFLLDITKEIKVEKDRNQLFYLYNYDTIRKKNLEAIMQSAHSESQNTIYMSYINLTNNKIVLLNNKDGIRDNFLNAKTYDEIFNLNILNIFDDYKKKFIELFDRKNLINSFVNEGKQVFKLKYLFLYQEKEMRYFQCSVLLLENIKNNTIEGYVNVEDLSSQMMNQDISKYLIEKDHEYVSVIDLLRDTYSNLSLNDMKVICFSKKVKECCDNYIASTDQEMFLENMNIKKIKEELDNNSQFSFKVRYIKDKHIILKKIQFHYFTSRKDLVLCMIDDVTDEFEKDSLTGYYNLFGFDNVVIEYLYNGLKKNQYLILYIDINDFKGINAELGHQAGDTFLKEYANILDEKLHAKAVARINGTDHFMVFAETKNFNYTMLKKVLNNIFVYGDKKIAYYARCGIYIVDDITLEIKSMYDKAKIAQSSVIDPSTKPYVIYEDKMKLNYMSQSEIKSKFEIALKNNEFRVYYQPIYDVNTKKIASAEALIRWITPDGNMMPPYKFIPVLENSGLISKIDTFVCESVAYYTLKRIKNNKHIVPISINLSWYDFYNKDCMDVIFDGVKKLNAMNIETRIEVTETSESTMNNDRFNLLQGLKKNGAKLLIDDFGSGYSTFSTLSDYDFDIIKIDMGFVRKIGLSKKAEKLIINMISIAHDIGAKVIAEGVEDKNQLLFLKQNKCDYIQGYYYSRPISEEEFNILLDENKEKE